MTTLTIIKDDSFVAVDGFGLEPIDCSSLAANVLPLVITQLLQTYGHLLKLLTIQQYQMLQPLKQL